MRKKVKNNEKSEKKQRIREKTMPIKSVVGAGKWEVLDILKQHVPLSLFQSPFPPHLSCAARTHNNRAPEEREGEKIIKNAHQSSTGSSICV